MPFTSDTIAKPTKVNVIMKYRAASDLYSILSVIFNLIHLFKRKGN